jgi:hypothetical protein
MTEELNSGNKKHMVILGYVLCTVFICIIAVIVFNMMYRSNMNLNNSGDNGSVISKKRENFSNTDEITKILEPLKLILDRFKYLDLPIGITDEFNMCNPWGTYDNSKYVTYNNVCLNIDNSGIRKCLSGSDNVLSSCNNLFKNGIIENNNEIKTDNMYDVAVNKMKSGISHIESLSDAKNTELSEKIENASKYKNIRLQQTSLINKNSIGLEDKRKIFTNKTNELENRQNQIELNQEKFNLFMDNNNKLTSRLALYKKIVIGLIITIIVVLILNYLISNIL